MVHLGPKKPPSRKATLEWCQDLQPLVEKYSKLLTVDTAKLKAITEHFVSELQKGLTVEGGSIPMNVAWVMNYPTGKEKGTFLALDMGGTNLRVAQITLDGKRGFDTTQSKYHLPDHIKTGSADELWGYIADCIGQFLDKYNMNKPKESIPIGFTFSYPATQHGINSGILQRWTKGFDIAGVEGHDVVPQFQKAIDERKIPVHIGALINDTTGTLVASNYVEPRTKMGCIFGTGCNAAYYDKVKNIPKIQGKLPDDIGEDSWMAINCEYGAFDNEHVCLPRTKYDEQLDAGSPRPGQQSFEKMIAGYTLGEIFRLILNECYDEGLIFPDEDISKLRDEYFLDAAFLSKIEEDPWENLSDTEQLFKDVLNIQTTEPERNFLRTLAELIGTRAARLSMCGVAAMATKMDMKEAYAGADGSVFNKYPHFRQRGAQALAEIFDWDMAPEDYPIKVIPAEDGSGVGAAIIAALTKERVAEGLSVGEKGQKSSF